MNPIVWLDSEQEMHKGDQEHPESPLRIKAIRTILQSQIGIVVKERSDPIPRILEPSSSHRWNLIDGDTYCTPYTGALLERGTKMIEEATRTLALHRTTCAFVCIRPPGHHANSKGIASGFCHQNNVWIAVEQLKQQGFHSIGIFDWDAHHGDGTEDCVRSAGDPNIRFVSMHAFGPGIFPGTGLYQSDTILNIPLKVGTDSETYVGHFTGSVLPFLAKGKPDILIISAGYDGHEKDPMGLLQLREQTYTYMSGQLKSLSCPVLFLLEGGYNPQVLGSCVEATLKPWLSSA
jgi:acetoin utilization deacetylase AcuC-like enzyme